MDKESKKEESLVQTDEQEEQKQDMGESKEVKEIMERKVPKKDYSGLFFIGLLLCMVVLASYAFMLEKNYNQLVYDYNELKEDYDNIFTNNFDDYVEDSPIMQDILDIDNMVDGTNGTNTSVM